MTRLYLKKDGGDWQQVFFSTSGSGFKLTRENPYFTSSESYTLDVTLPMGIVENIQFIGSIHRMDITKKTIKYGCRLIVDNETVLEGTARVSQVTDTTVKLQLLGGKSELNFLSKESGAYIDEMDLGSYSSSLVWVDYKGESTGFATKPDYIAYLPAYDETAGVLMNELFYNKDTGNWGNGSFLNDNRAPQPNLLYILRAVLYKSGYTLTDCDIDCEPWNRLFVASAKFTRHLSHTLPHWHVGEFLSEICHLFNITLMVDSVNKAVGVHGNSGFFNNGSRSEIVPVEEYTTEIEGDEDSGTETLASSDIEFDMSSSSSHVYDILSDDVREAIPHKTYESKAHLSFDFASMGHPENLKYLYYCPTGTFIGWKDRDHLETPAWLEQVDQFAPLKRNAGGDDSISLKICPVALYYDDDALAFGDFQELSRTSSVVMSLENPTGNEVSYPDDEDTWAQDFIDGTQSINKTEKEDRLQVFFLDKIQQESVVQSGAYKGTTVPLTMPFTDFSYMTNSLYRGYSPWSLALVRSEATNYLGQLHNSGFTFDTKVKYTFKFVSDRMPDPTSVFHIRGKLYACEKIEANVTEEGFDRLMTGYFYELL